MPRRGPLLDDDAGAVRANRLLRRRQGKGRGEGEDLEGDEDDDGDVGDLAAGGAARVEPEVDGAADELAGVLEGEPEGEVAAAAGVGRVGQDDGALCGPVEAGAEPADGGAEDNEPLGAVAVVLVQGGAVDGPAEGAEDEGGADADAVDGEGGEDAEEAHEGEDEGVAGVDLEVCE